MRRSFITHLVCLFAVPLVVVGVAMPALAQCPLSFNAASNYAAGNFPASVAVGDFNADGRPDLAVANQGSSNVSILLGNGGGGGTFQAAVNYAAGSGPVSVAVGDFNGDGSPDLAVPNGNSATVSILLGNAPPNAGTFAAPVNYAAGSIPRSVAVGDFNADGRPDLAVVNSNSANVSILLGNGDGTFLPAVNYAAGIGPVFVAVGDFNADGQPDLATANSGNNVSILLGNGNGTFQGPVNYSVGTSPQSVAVGDFNADGWPDLAVANANGNNVSILLGNANGTFQPAVNYAAGTSPRSVAVGDFNADGRPDLAVANFSSDNVSILLGNLSGTFQPAVNYAAGSGPRSVAVGDFNGDGSPDLAVANFNSNNVSVLLNTTSFLPPIITQQPVSQSVLSGGTAEFTVAATTPAGTGTLMYQWRKDGVNLSDGGTVSGATTTTLTIGPADLSDNGAAFDAVVTNDCGSARSDPAGLGVTWSCPADFDTSGTVAVPDIFAFLSAWFSGCP